ncbi:hypothetical protein V6Z11_A04G023100 [Gossypium hirsutum]
MTRERRNHPITKKGRAIELRRIRGSRVRSSHAQGSPSERYHERILKNQEKGGTIRVCLENLVMRRKYPRIRVTSRLLKVTLTRGSTK